MNVEKKNIEDNKDNNNLKFIDKRSKFKKIFIISIFLFLIGHLFIYIGLAKGHDIAINLSRPYNASSWSTSGEFIKACIYSFVLLGGSLVFTSIAFMIVTLKEWLRLN